MGGVTITVLQGSDRGRTFRELEPPITVGREEGNTIQLNDERVSRCHLKIQEDNERLVLTDLDSTNGTKVNGQESHLRILRHGDLIAVGRSVMLVGTEDQIAARMRALQSGGEDAGATISREFGAASEAISLSSGDFELGDHLTAGTLAATLGLTEPPEAPENLTPSQAAQVCEILEFIHERFRRLIDGAQVDEQNHSVTIGFATWQRLIDLQARVGLLLRQIADPEWPGGK